MNWNPPISIAPEWEADLTAVAILVPFIVLQTLAKRCKSLAAAG